MQVLVYHDLLGMMQHPHHAKVDSTITLFGFISSSSSGMVCLKWDCCTFLQVTPKFCKQFGQVGDVINKALLEYKEEVTNGSFPGAAYSPYKIGGADVDGFLNELQKLGLNKAADAAEAAAEKMTVC